MDTDEHKIPPFQERLYKNKKSDKVYWVDTAPYCKGLFEFTFDKKKVYNLFLDYPHNMSPEEVEIFDKENPYWRDYFDGID